MNAASIAFDGFTQYTLKSQVGAHQHSMLTMAVGLDTFGLAIRSNNRYAIARNPLRSHSVGDTPNKYGIENHWHYGSY
jgi:hypothetical protein